MKLTTSSSSISCNSFRKNPYNLLRNSLISIFAIAALGGCLGMSGDQLDVDSSQREVITINSLGVSDIVDNKLSFAALTTSSVADSYALELDAVSAGHLADTESGRTLLQYVARCALPATHTLRVVSERQSWTFPGALGLTPEWSEGPLDEPGQELLSACLLSHVNFFESEVPFSARTARLAPAEGDETAAYFYGDGAFYGNLFGDSAEKYACKIRSNDVYDAELGEYVPASSPYEARRICAGEDTAADCDFVFTGYCDEVCKTISPDGAQWQYSDCQGADGRSYEQVVSVWLEGEFAESCSTAPDGFTCMPE